MATAVPGLREVPLDQGLDVRLFRRRADSNPPDRVYVVFSYGDPCPIAACATSDMAEQYAEALGQLPVGHPLRTIDALVDVLPLNHRLPEPLRDAENQPIPL